LSIRRRPRSARASQVAVNSSPLRRNSYERLPNGLLRQRPGAGNALGHFKFIFPNQHSVYLHDTPSRHLFERPTRAFSHGCVRIADPRGFADWLLAAQPERGEIDRLLGRGVERRIDLDEKVPVHLLYWTASVGEGGEVRFHRDVYAQDAKLRGVL
jgi:murein L,D-transpeptidase YcbB/YkuD